MSSKFLLIDANSLIHRAYHALPNLKSSKGQYTGAIFGFVNLFLKIVKEQKPTHVAAAFDLKGPTFRHEIYPQYKGTRRPMDEELAVQFQPIKDLLGLMGVRCVSKEGYEADDVLGTLSCTVNGECIVLTGDRDSLQLVSDTTRVFRTVKGVTDIEVYDLARLAEDGFTPDTFIDYKALRGDPSDNIPGVPGVGEKTAKQLLDSYGTLEGVLEHADEVKGKLGENLRANREKAELSRKLATIVKDVPLGVSEEDLRFENVYSAEVKARLSEYELNSLIPRMNFAAGVDLPAVAAVEKKVVVVSSSQEIAKAVSGDEVAVVIGDEITFSCDGVTEFRVDCAVDLFGGGMDFEAAARELAAAVADKRLICYDFKRLIKKYGFANAEFFDVMIAAHLVRGSAPIKSLDAVLGTGDVASAADLFRFADEARKSIKSQGLEKAFYEVELPLVPVLADMERIGVCVDSDALAALKVKYEDKLSRLSEEIFALAGQTFNIASPKQLGEILFDKLGLRHGKKTKTGWSVGEETLSAVAADHPIVAMILDWRHYSKLLGTYVTGMQPLVTRGKIHTEFNQCVTATGRLSSTGPNLQNIPVRGEEAKDVKSAFTASEGCVLVSADYSQIELRLLAHFSGDENLVRAFVEGNDIHALTAASILGIPVSEVTPAERRDAKAVNFGIIYGMSDFGLAENLAIPKYKAKEFIDKYFLAHPSVRAYLDGCINSARETGFAVTLLGRKRALPEINSSNYHLRTAAERMAMNTPLQGTAAEIVKKAMLAVHKRLENMRAKMILQIHDELVVDAPEEEADEVVKILKEEMEKAVELKVPLVVDTNAARRWGDLK